MPEIKQQGKGVQPYIRLINGDSDRIVMGHLMGHLGNLYTCLRGPQPSAAVIISADDYVVMFGGVFPPEGSPSCIESGECMMVDGHCVRNIHAEVNAILLMARGGYRCNFATIYSWNKPCYACTCAIIQAGITRIVYRHVVYDEERTQQAIECAGIICEQFTGELE